MFYLLMYQIEIFKYHVHRNIQVSCMKVYNTTLIFSKDLANYDEVICRLKLKAWKINYFDFD